MAVSDEQRNKILDGAGLEQYTKLIKTRFNSIDAEIDGITTTVESITTTIAGLTSTYKALQNAATFTAPAGSYISGLEQNEQGVVTASTTALPTVDAASTTTAGVVQMADGATTSVVYSKEQIDEISAYILGQTTDDIAGLTETYKQLQTATNSGATAALTFIDYIAQDTQGVITTTKSTVTLPSAASDTTPGLVTMAAGATTTEVLDKDQVMGLIAGVSGDVSGLTGTFKQLQNAVSNPVASGNTITFISEITQDAQGVISPIAMTVPTASSTTIGLVQMSAGATTSVVYDKDEVDSLIAEQASAAFVAAITATIPSPAADADNNTIYFIANGATTGNNIYDEYLKVNKGSAETPNYAMEKIGSTEFSFDTLSDGDVTTIWTDTPAAE